MKNKEFIAMKRGNHHERIQKMNRLIQCGQTGTPAEFARVMGISQSHLYRFLNELESHGMDIQYSRSMQTYFYGNDSELTICYSPKLIADSKTKEIMGGMRLLKNITQSYTEEHRFTLR